MNRVLVFVAVIALILSMENGSSAQDPIRTSNPLERGLGEDDFPRVQKIADNVYTYEALTGRPDDRYTTNTMFVVTDEGVLVADGQGNPDATLNLVAAIGDITDQPITHVVICSDHGDHTNGNVSFPRTAQFIAHPNSKANLERTRANPNRNAESPEVILPTELVEDRRVLELGGTEIQILFLGRAHTGGDLFVYLPEEKILFTTEVFLNRLFSGYRSSYPSEWLQVMDKAEELDVDMYLPGHGFIDDARVLAEEWLEYKRHMAAVLVEVKRLHALGLSVEEAIEQADFGEYASWSGAGSQGPGGIRRIYAELNGELP